MCAALSDTAAGRPLGQTALAVYHLRCTIVVSPRTTDAFSALEGSLANLPLPRRSEWHWNNIESLCVVRRR